MHVLVFYRLLNWKMHGETLKNIKVMFDLTPPVFIRQHISGERRQEDWSCPRYNQMWRIWKITNHSERFWRMHISMPSYLQFWPQRWPCKALLPAWPQAQNLLRMRPEIPTEFVCGTGIFQYSAYISRLGYSGIWRCFIVIDFQLCLSVRRSK